MGKFTYFASSLFAFTAAFHITTASATPQQFQSTVSQVQLIELYTSEGCSSCPPADRRLSKLKSDVGLWSERIPVAFHVDYWDYIGWEDPYAHPDNSKRQRVHAALGNVSNVYTPGFLVDGAEWRGFFSGAVLPLQRQQMPGPLALSYDSGEVKVSFDPAQEVPEQLNLQIAWLGAGIESSVTDGENMGRSLKHDFVVLKRQELAFNSAAGFEHQGEFTADDLAPAEQYALVAWLEDPRGRPVQAVGGWATP